MTAALATCSCTYMGVAAWVVFSRALPAHNVRHCWGCSCTERVLLCILQPELHLGHDHALHLSTLR